MLQDSFVINQDGAERGNLMVDKKFEGLVHFIIDILSLQLLCDKVGNDGVDTEVQLLDSLLSILSSGFSTL